MTSQTKFLPEDLHMYAENKNNIYLNMNDLYIVYGLNHVGILVKKLKQIINAQFILSNFIFFFLQF